MLGFNDQVDRLMESTFEMLKQLDAEVIDPVIIPTYPRLADLEGEALLWEFKSDLNAYLETRDATVRSLKDVIDFNARNLTREMRYFGQDVLMKAQAKGSTNSRGIAISRPASIGRRMRMASIS
jgi:amidase